MGIRVLRIQIFACREILARHEDVVTSDAAVAVGCEIDSCAVGHHKRIGSVASIVE